MARSLICVVVVLMSWSRTAWSEPVPIPLWDGPAPGAHGTDPDCDVPRLYPFLPEGAPSNGCAIVICVGGGYSNIWSIGAEEGFGTAQWFARRGFACFVLRYRLGGDGYAYPEITADITRAMRLVRSRARQWGIDTARIGVLGFSAGGHLASTVSTHYDQGNPQAADTVDRVGSRPAFSILIYPVITMDSRWTFRLGVQEFYGLAQPSQALIDSFSNEKHVTANTPPALLGSSLDDSTVNVINSTMYRDSCLAHGVKARFMALDSCSHGSGMCGHWADTAIVWLAELGILKPQQAAVEPEVRKAPGRRSGPDAAVRQLPGAPDQAMYDIAGRRIQSGAVAPRASVAGGAQKRILLMAPH